MSPRHNWPDLDRESAGERIDHGLGGSRYKEYDTAPYTEIVRATVPVILWTGVFYSWLSLKGHLQGFHGLERTEAYGTRFGDVVHVEFITIWRNAEALGEWITHGYPVEEMLRFIGIAEEDIHVQLVRYVA